MILARGNVTFDTRSGCIRAGSTEHVPPGPGIVLEVLLRTNSIVSRDALLDRIWNNRANGPDAKIVDIYVCKLRHLLTAIGADISISTSHGRGYGIEPPGGSTAEAVVPVTLLHEAAVALRRIAPSLARKIESYGPHLHRELA